MIHYKARNLIVDQKTGFRNTTGKPILIYDVRGIEFYNTRELDHVVWQFNLPKGEYYLKEGEIKKMPRPVEYDLLPLPQPERNKRGIPEHFDLYFDENPYKATVFWDKKAMLFDNELKDAPLPALVTIHAHECGHKYYKTEEYCDRFAYNQMIEAGYNPSQVAFAFVKTLSEKQLPRKNALVNAMFAQSNSFDHYEYAPTDTENDVNHADAGYYIGSTLMLKSNAKPMGIWSANTLQSKLLKTVSPGGLVGTIYSYVVDSNGQLWWELVNGGFVQHKEGLFDIDAAQQTASGKQFEAEKERLAQLSESNDVLKLGSLTSGLGDTVKFFGDNMKWILLILLLILLAPYVAPAIKSFSKS